MKLTNKTIAQAKALKTYFESLDEKYDLKKHKPISIRTYISAVTPIKKKDEDEYVYESEVKRRNARVSKAINEIFANSLSNVVNTDTSIKPYWMKKNVNNK